MKKQTMVYKLFQNKYKLPDTFGLEKYMINKLQMYSTHAD